jgi:hypothetical protein
MVYTYSVPQRPTAWPTEWSITRRKQNATKITKIHGSSTEKTKMVYGDYWEEDV